MGNPSATGVRGYRRPPPPSSTSVRRAVGAGWPSAATGRLSRGTLRASFPRSGETGWSNQPVVTPGFPPIRAKGGMAGEPGPKGGHFSGRSQIVRMCSRGTLGLNQRGGQNTLCR